MTTQHVSLSHKALVDKMDLELHDGDGVPLAYLLAFADGNTRSLESHSQKLKTNRYLGVWRLDASTHWQAHEVR